MRLPATRKECIEAVSRGRVSREEYEEQFDWLVEHGYLQGSPNAYGEVHYRLTERGLLLLKLHEPPGPEEMSGE